jgi:uncharacterized small protein (DUF1192 family)
MAKAIYGHTGTDARLSAEVVRLRARVRELQAEVDRLQAEAEARVATADWAADEWRLADDLLVPDPR